MVNIGEVLSWLSDNADWLSILTIISVFTIITIRYYDKKDQFEPEPRRRLIWGFILGIISVIPALLLSIFLLNYVPQEYSSVIVAPVAEEIAKAFFVLWLARSDEMDGPLDGMIYGAMVGTGFAFAENLLYAFTNFFQSGFISGLLVASFRSAVQIIGHPLFTGIAGYGIGAYKGGFGKGKLIPRLLGAMVIHGMWNASTGLGSLWIIAFLGMIVLLIIILRRELNKAVELDRQAYERGYYGDKNIPYTTN